MLRASAPATAQTRSNDGSFLMNERSGGRNRIDFVPFFRIGSPQTDKEYAVGHKPDQQARMRRRLREEKKRRETDFRAKLRAASEGARSIYDECIREVRACKQRGETVASVSATGSDEDRAAATALLSHPHNGFTAYIKPGGESPGGSASGASPPSIVVTL